MPSASDARAPGVVFDGVWKKFRTGEAHDSLRDLIPALVGRATGGRPGASRDLRAREFWAVRDVSFHVGPGEVLGIIGANGAGKSTILKLLTRVLRPTHGRIETRGRVGALIEVAAGFHPDLTGRENVFLQGAILGMPAREVRRKFDAIVEFAGVEEFVDTPVKRYSTGMNARLGFAIAAHLEPDVLVTDEVLAVGDFAFQARAFSRLGALAAGGVPVVVVSHQLERVVSLCSRALVLQRGAIAYEGEPAACVAWYTSNSAQAPTALPEDLPVHLRQLTVEALTVPSGELLTVRMSGTVRSLHEMDDIETVGLRIRSTSTGEVLTATSSAQCRVPIARTGAFELECVVQLNVSPGVYCIETHPWDRRLQRQLHPSLVATVTVTEGRRFSGIVQCNVSMRLLPGASDDGRAR